MLVRMGGKLLQSDDLEGLHLRNHPLVWELRHVACQVGWILRHHKWKLQWEIRLNILEGIQPFTKCTP